MAAYQEFHESNITKEVRVTNILMLGVIAISLAAYAYLHRESSVDPDVAYPKPGCFQELDAVQQADFLNNRDFIIAHPDAYSPYTEQALLYSDCPPMDTTANVGTLSP